MKKIQKGLALLLVGVSLSAMLAAGCQKKEEELTVYMPDGAPALALAGLMAEDTKEDGVSYRVVNPQKIAATITYEQEEKNADLCVLPLTAASKLVGNGERYTLLGTVTHGNLYLISKTEESIDDLTELVGKRVGVLQMKEVPGLTFKTTLQKAGVPFQELTGGAETASNQVNLLAMTGAADVGVLEADYYLLAEPAVTVQASKGYTIVGDLQALYGGEKGYPQAVLVAKNALVQTKQDWLLDWTEKLQDTTWLTQASGEEIVDVLASHLEDKTAESSFKASQLTQEVIARCGISFTYAWSDAGEIESFLTGLLAVAPQATKLPTAAFYWKQGEE